MTLKNLVNSSRILILIILLSFNANFVSALDVDRSTNRTGPNHTVEKVSSPKIDIESLSIASIDLSALNLALRLSVTNTSNRDVTVTSVIYEVHSMSTMISGRIDQIEIFKAKEQRIVGVPVSLQHSSTSLIVLDALKSESRSIPYKIIGKIKINGVDDMIPFEHDGEYLI